MIFIHYLSPTGQEIINHLISTKFHIHENIGLCKNVNVFGYADKPKKFVICTQNIKNSGYDLDFYVNETVYHEAVHSAQNCKKTDTIGYSKKSMPLPWNKLQDIKNSITATKNYGSEMREREALWLEDKPDKVLYYVKKFCF